MKAVSKKSEGKNLIAIIGDEVGWSFILGHGNGVLTDWDRGKECKRRQQLSDSWRKYVSCEIETTKSEVEATFRRFLKDSDISVILITQDSS